MGGRVLGAGYWEEDKVLGGRVLGGQGRVLGGGQGLGGRVLGAGQGTGGAVGAGRAGQTYGSTDLFAAFSKTLHSSERRAPCFSS